MGVPKTGEAINSLWHRHWILRRESYAAQTLCFCSDIFIHVLMFWSFAPTQASVYLQCSLHLAWRVLMLLYLTLLGMQTNCLDLTLLSLFMLSPLLSLTCWAGLRRTWGSTHKLQCWGLPWRLAKTSTLNCREHTHTPIISSYITFNLPPYYWISLLKDFFTERWSQTRKPFAVI